MMNVPILIAQALLLGALVSGLASQRTWLVDCAGRPWSDFSDLPPAVAAAAPGDTIHLYGDNSCGLYVLNAVVIDKPLRIIGSSPAGGIGYPAGANLFGRLEIRNIPAGSEVVISHIWLGASGRLSVPPWVAPHGVDVRNCAGRVLFDHVVYQGAGQLNGVLVFEDCADVILDHSSFSGTAMPTTFRRARCQMTASGMSPAAIGPLPYLTVPQTFEGMYIEDSDVTMIASGVGGASEENHWPQPFRPARAAVVLQSGFLRLGPGTLVMGGLEPDPTSTWGLFRSVAAITTSIPSHVLIDPRATAGSNNWGIANPTFQYLHGIDHTPVTQNEQYSVRVMGPPGGFMLLALSTSINPWVQTGIGLLGVDPSSLTVLACAALPPGSGTATQTSSVWRNIPINTVFAFQAAVMNPAGTISLTLPTPFMVGWMAGRTMP